MGGNRASNKQIKVGVNDIVAGDNIDVVDSNGSITVSTDSDMSKSTYDPTTKNSDSFDMDNMDEGANTKILTSSERTNIATNTTKISYTDSAEVAANTAKVGITPTQASDITSNNSKISYTDAAVVSTNASDIDTLELNNTGTNTGDQDISGISTNAGNISTNEGNINNNAIDINTLETNNTGVNTGDQDLSSLATKANVLELDNTTSFTPNADYEPATKKYVDDSTSDVTKIIGGNGITVSPGNGLGDVTINLDGSTGDYTEWATYIGTRAGQDLVVTIGDYDSAGNGTSIKVNDALQKIIASKLIQAENGIESDANNGVMLNNLANDGKVTFKASNISSGDDINLEVQDVSGVIALISDISGIAINAGDIATNTGDILTLQTNNTGVNTGDQDVSGIAINASAINTLETNNTGVNTGDQDVSGIAVNAGDISTLEINNTGVNTGDQDISGIAVNASAINTLEINNTGVNTGDQDISGFAEKTNVLELDNTDIFVPTTDYMPATKKYVDDSNGVASIVAGDGINISDSGGNVTINNDNVEWSSFTGTQSGGSIDLFIGDYDNQGEGTTIQLDDGNNTVYITGLTHLNGNVTIENDSTLDFNDGTYNSKIQSGSNSSDATLTLPIITGTIALTSDIAAVISDDAYDADWNGVTNIAPSQNAVYDKMEQFLTSSNLQETLDSGSSAIGVDGNTTVDISIEGASAFSFEKTDASNDINYGVDSNSIYSSLFNQLNDSLSSVLAINGEVQLVTSNVADGQSKTILNIPTAATDGFEFQVNVPRPTLVADTEITMPISINNNFADANGNLNIAVEGGVQTIIAGAGIAISPPGGIGNVIISLDSEIYSPLTTKGDLFTYSDEDIRLAIGTDSQVLTVDLSEPTGLKWVDASSGAVADRIDTSNPISGTKDIEWQSFEVFDFSLTENTVITESILPEVGTAKVITVYIDPNGYIANLPSDWVKNSIGDLSSSLLNQIVVEYRASEKYFMSIVQPEVRPLGEPMIMNINTEAAGSNDSADNQIILPFLLGETVNLLIDWGDNSTLESYTNTDEMCVHEYEVAGVYDVSIYNQDGLGRIPWSMWATASDRKDFYKFSDLKQFGDCEIYQLAGETPGIFRSTYNLDITATDTGERCIKLSTDLTNMFYATAVTEFKDSATWDTSNITDFTSAFRSITELTTLTAGNWEMSQVESISAIFNGTNGMSFSDVGQWNIGPTCTDISYAFYKATLFEHDLSGWDMSGVINMESAFEDCTLFTGQGLSSWNVSSVEDLEGTFTGCTIFNADLSGWNLVSCKTLYETFSECTQFTGIGLNTWTTSSSLTNLGSAFSDCINFDANVAGWDMSGVTSVSAMFDGCTAFTGQGFDTWTIPSTLTSLSFMLRDCINFNADVTGWNTSGVISMGGLFSGVTSFNQDLSGWDFSSVSNLGSFGANWGMSTENYDLLLTSLSNQTLQTYVYYAEFGSFYTADYSITGNNAFISGVSNSNKVISNDPAETFLTSVQVGDIVKGNSTGNYAAVVSVDSNTELTLDKTGLFQSTGASWTIEGGAIVKNRYSIINDNNWVFLTDLGSVT